MPKYLVCQQVRAEYSILVEAENEEQAVDNAFSVDLWDWNECYWDNIGVDVLIQEDSNEQ